MSSVNYGRFSKLRQLRDVDGDPMRVSDCMAILRLGSSSK
jgi:hypothetical protein